MVRKQRPIKPPSPLPDIDGADRSNPLAACEYVNDLYGYYRRVEPQFLVPADYMSQQVRCFTGGSWCVGLAMCNRKLASVFNSDLPTAVVVCVVND